MNYEDTVKRAEKLRKDLNYYSYRYYVDNENDIDDYEYDMMMRELKELEEKGVGGQILTTNYLNFSEPRALEKLNELKNITLKMYGKLWYQPIW